MSTCYIAGPMRSKPCFNFPAFYEAEARLREAGWTVVNPARMDTQFDRTSTSLTLEQQQAHASDPANARRYAMRDLAAITTALRAEEGDALVLLPDWQESTGAQAEVAVAQWVGLKVMTLEEALQ